MYFIYSFGVIICLIVTVLAVVSYMEHVIKARSAGAKEFKVRELEYDTPQSALVFLAMIVIFSIAGIILSVLWPISIPLLYCIRFKNIDPPNSTED